MAKKKPLKKDRKAGSRPANAGPKKPFYQEIGAKRPQKKKPHPFGKGWELAEDFDRLEEGEYAVRCTALDEDGNGIVQIEGVSFAVSGLLPGEEGTVAVSGRKKQRAQLVRVDKAVPERVKPRCPVFGRCGGCRLQHLSYDGQLELKQRTVEQLMQEYIAQGAKFYQILGMSEPWRYRNKAHATFSLDGRGRIVSGIYEESSHRVVPVERCLIQDERAEQIAASVRQIMRECRIQPYDEDRGTGLLRHILVRTGFASGQVMVVLVTASPIFPARSRFVSLLREKHPEITTIVMNCNPKQTSMVLGTQERVLYGKGFIEDSLCGLRFAISPRSFYQVNPVQTEVLYQRAIQMAQLTGQERVLDAYCGIGTISLIAAGQAKEVIGVELNRDAVQDAIANAKRNGVRNATFICEDAGRFMTRMAQEREGVDVVFLDPPRSGSDEAFLRSLCALGPKRVVYISCNPQTQKRDLAVLAAGGYRVEAIQPVDMFPQTGHIETVVWMSRQNL